MAQPCTDDGNVCTDDQCDGAGACVHPNNSNPCNDEIACTENDVCSGGECHGISNNALCDDGNVCTDDTCDPASGCVYTNNNDPCEDIFFCNGTDTCSDGSCSVHSGDPCTDDGLFCNGDESCNEVNDQCESSGDPCPDNGEYCDGVEYCDEDSNSCVSSSPCPLGTTCNEDLDSCESSPTTTPTTTPTTIPTTIPTTTSTTTIVLSTTTTVIEPPTCEVNITPPSATVPSGQTISFSAETVGEGCEKGSYEWTVDSSIGSNIDDKGVYTAGTVAGTDTVTATDAANGTEATAEVIVYTETTTTTSISLLWPMAYDKMWGAKKYENLLLLRVFRDEILLNTEVARGYISMLYDNSFEIAILLLQEPSLTAQTREVIDQILISVESLLYNDEMEISQDIMNNFITLLDQFETKASPKLKTAISKLKRDINKAEIFKQLGIIICE